MQTQSRLTKTVWRIPSTSIIYHCSDVYRNNILFCKVDLRTENTTADKISLKNQVYLDIDKMVHYSNGNSFEFSNKWSILLTREKEKEEKVTGLLNVSPIDIHITQNLLKEFEKIQNLNQTVKTYFKQDCTDYGIFDMWTQSKISKTNVVSVKQHPIITILQKSKFFKFPQHPVTLKCESTSMSLYLCDINLQPVLVTRMKLFGNLKQFYKNPEFEGNINVEAVIRNRNLNRWEHLFNCDGTSSNSVNMKVNVGLVDSESVMDNLEEIPFSNKGKSRTIIRLISYKNDYFQKKVLIQMMKSIMLLRKN